MSKPQSKSQYIEEQKRICETEWFKDHKATMILNRPEVIIIYWQNPASWNYGCRFIIHNGWLTVIGDIGEAVYQWSDKLTLEFLAQIDFGYFLGKCQASPDGRKFEQWDSAVAFANIATAREVYRAVGIDELASIVPNSCRDEYDAAARACYDRCGDAEAASSIAGAGLVPSVHAIGHFVGLQMAIKQLLKP